MTTHPGELVPPLLPETRSAMSLPLHAKGTIIGALELQSAQRSAFLPKDLVILQDTADQIAAALTAADRIRELESELAGARHASGRERLVSEIATRMHESRDMDAVLKTAAYEIHRALGLRDISIRLGETDQPAQNPSPEEALS
jgi:transcriptional regulator with GAF, ATPase, and Fis domain